MRRASTTSKRDEFPSDQGHDFKSAIEHQLNWSVVLTLHATARVVRGAEVPEARVADFCVSVGVESRHLEVRVARTAKENTSIHKSDQCLYFCLWESWVRVPAILVLSQVIIDEVAIDAAVLSMFGDISLHCYFC